MMELSEDFLKMLQIAMLVVGLLIIFLIFISYNIEVFHDEKQRSAYVLGDYLLASDCIAWEDNGNVVKGVLSEGKLDTVDPSCINYPYGSIEVELLEDIGKGPWVIGMEDAEGERAVFTVVVKLTNGEIKTAKMTVTLDVFGSRVTCNSDCKDQFGEQFSGTCLTTGGTSTCSGTVIQEGCPDGYECCCRGTYTASPEPESQTCAEVGGTCRPTGTCTSLIEFRCSSNNYDCNYPEYCCCIYK
jgi:hypothetical protein